MADHRARLFIKNGKKLQKTTCVGTDAFHPRVLLDLSDDTCQKVLGFLHVVEVVGQWPAAASCIMFFQLSQAVDSDRPIALTATLIRRQGRHRKIWETQNPFGWDAPTKKKSMWSRIQSVKRCWSLGPYETEASPKDPGAATKLMDVQKAIENS